MATDRMITDIRRRNLARLLSPTSIAVVGASADPTKAGSQALQVLSRFPGRRVAGHPREKEIQGVNCYPSFAALPEPIEKCAVRSASPISTTLSKLQCWFQIAGKLRQ